MYERESGEESLWKEKGRVRVRDRMHGFGFEFGLC